MTERSLYRLKVAVGLPDTDTPADWVEVWACDTSVPGVCVAEAVVDLRPFPGWAPVHKRSGWALAPPRTLGLDDSIAYAEWLAGVRWPIDWEALTDPLTIRQTAAQLPRLN